MLKKIVILTALTVIAVFAGTVHAANEMKTNIPVRYIVTQGEETDSTFTLTAKGNSPMPEGSEGNTKSISMKTSGRVDFGDIIFTTQDLYEYTISKDTKDEEGLTKDESVYNVFVMTTSDGNVSVIIKKENSEEKPDEILYQDSVMKLAQKSCYDDPPVLKKVQGKTDVTDEFTFMLKAIKSTTGELPMPEGVSGREMTTTALPGEEKEFGRIIFTKEGVYEYEISEVNTGLKGYTYDTTIYDVKYTVSEKDGELSCVRTVSVNGKEQPIAVFEFVNVYSAVITPPPGDDPRTVPPAVEKIQKSNIYKNTIGRIPRTGDSFNPFIIFVTMLISLAGVGTYVYVRKREKKEVRESE